MGMCGRNQGSDVPKTGPAGPRRVRVRETWLWDREVEEVEGRKGQSRRREMCFLYCPKSAARELVGREDGRQKMRRGKAIGMDRRKGEKVMSEAEQQKEKKKRVSLSRALRFDVNKMFGVYW